MLLCSILLGKQGTQQFLLFTNAEALTRKVREHNAGCAESISQLIPQFVQDESISCRENEKKERRKERKKESRRGVTNFPSFCGACGGSGWVWLFGPPPPALAVPCGSPEPCRAMPPAGKELSASYSPPALYDKKN